LLLIGLSLISESAHSYDRNLIKWAKHKPTIDTIVVEGNEFFSSSRIKSVMYSRPRNLWLVIKGDRRSRLQRETLNRDTLEIKFLYLTNGYLGVRVDEKYEILIPDSTALVRITIDEGDQFLYGEKNIAGSFERRFTGPLTGIANRLKENKPISIFDLRDAIFEMKTVLANGGYPYATIDYFLDTINHRDIVPVTFTVDSDSLVHFGNVILEGFNSFPESAGRRELTIRKGDVYRRQAILDSQRRMFESGYFSTLQLRQHNNNSDRLNPNFLLRVRERKPLYLTFTTGAGQSEYRDLQWDVSGAFGKRNLFGTRRADLSIKYSFGFGRDSRLFENRYRLRLTEPWPFGIRTPLTLTGEIQPKLKDPAREFDKRSWSVSVATTQRFGPYVRTSLGLEYQFVGISGVPDDEVELLKQDEGNSARRKLYATYRRDSRNDLFVPTWGSVTELTGEYFGGFLSGDESFFKLGASWSRYQPVWPGWIYATRFKLGWAEEFGESDAVPSDEIFLLGGANSIRGFLENSLGPLSDEGRVEGARVVGIFNQEFRWKTIQVLQVLPLVGDLFRPFPLWQSIFIDVGNGFRYRREITLDKLAYSYGTGIQLVSPAGPIRIDYARRIRTPRYDFDYRWHFTILYAF
jgi:outer membrane protein insertion porin family